jgi:hypothetical protein
MSWKLWTKFDFIHGDILDTAKILDLMTISMTALCWGRLGIGIVWLGRVNKTKSKRPKPGSSQRLSQGLGNLKTLALVGLLGLGMGCSSPRPPIIQYEECGSNGFRTKVDISGDPYYHYSTCIPCSEAYPTADPFGPIFICTGKVQKP